MKIGSALRVRPPAGSNSWSGDIGDEMVTYVTRSHVPLDYALDLIVKLISFYTDVKSNLVTAF